MILALLTFRYRAAFSLSSFSLVPEYSFFDGVCQQGCVVGISQFSEDSSWNSSTYVVSYGSPHDVLTVEIEQVWGKNTSLPDSFTDFEFITVAVFRSYSRILIHVQISEQMDDMLREAHFSHYIWLKQGKPISRIIVNSSPFCLQSNAFSYSMKSRTSCFSLVVQFFHEVTNIGYLVSGSSL